MHEIAKNSRARLLFEPVEMNYDPGPDHPLQPKRLQALIELLEASDLWHPNQASTRLRGRSATLDELRLVHTPGYVSAVQQLSVPARPSTTKDEQQAREHLAATSGLDEGDTPAFPGMHDAAAAIAGGTLVALSAVMGLAEGGHFSDEDERPLHVFHPAGG